MGEKNGKLIILPAVLIAVDQTSKYLIRSHGGFYICNSDLAFGINILDAAILFALIIVGYVMYKFANNKYQITIFKQRTNIKLQISKSWFENFKNKNLKLFEIWHYKFGILIIISGAISNLTDRFIHGCVIDFIDVHFWPIFNAADVFITAGAIMIVWGLIKKEAKD